jgi:uncharacterized protein YjbI with pentapeptide repeats
MNNSYWTRENIEETLVSLARGEVFDLSHTDLRHIDLSGLDFRHIKLKLDYAKLENVIFSDNIFTVGTTSFKNTSFLRCKLHKVYIGESDLTASVFTSCIMDEVVFKKCNFNSTFFGDCNIIRSSFRDCVFKSQFHSCSIDKSQFIRCTLESSAFKNTKYIVVVFSSVNLTDCDFNNCEFDEWCSFFNVIGNSRTIYNIHTTSYHVVYVVPTGMLQIGCELHKATDWWEFDEYDIEDMDGNQAVNFWDKWKTILQLWVENIKEYS